MIPSFLFLETGHVHFLEHPVRFAGSLVSISVLDLSVFRLEFDFISRVREGVVGLPNSNQLHCNGVGGKVMEKVGI